MADAPSFLGDALAGIRAAALAIAGSQWTGLGDLADAVLPHPLDPTALLPVATGRAFDGDLPALVPIAAVVTLASAALRIAEDCADRDRSGALPEAVGPGRALNYAMALSAAARDALAGLPLARARLDPLSSEYTRAFLRVCRGQDEEMRQTADDLPAYLRVVELKTVAAYEFAAMAGARAAGAEAEAVATSATCGAHLGWMVQILDDLESLWFPATPTAEVGRPTFPLLVGMATEHAAAGALRDLVRSGERDRARACALLDELAVRPRLMSRALDHRDEALACLDRAPNPQGRAILSLWLDWLLRDGGGLLPESPR